MNYLAHIYLSGPDGRRQIGNFIGDAIKGNSYNDYPAQFREGILLHRAIDVFTDNHPAVKAAVRSMRPQFGRYSGALLDIFFDYLLASRFGKFSDTPLKRFSRRFYGRMIRYRRYLPERIRHFMWHFILTGRLGQYATKAGIRESLSIMVSVGRMDIPVQEAMLYLDEHEEELWAVFDPFFAELRAFCGEYIQNGD